MSRTTHPRGFAKWRPQAASISLVAEVEAILSEYREQLPLTLRQVFYIAFTRALIDKDEHSYDRLYECLGRARRAEMIGIDAFRDDGFSQADAPGWYSAGHFIRNVAAWLDDFTLVRQAGQSRQLTL